MSKPRTSQMAQSFRTTPADPWTAFFEGGAHWSTKQAFLANGLVDLDVSPSRPTEILAAYVRSLVGLDKGLAAPDRAVERPPADLRDLDESAASLTLRLMGCGALPFATVDETRLDLLDVALRMNWGSVVLSLLARPDVPVAADLERRHSKVRLGGDALPWLHALTLGNRTAELEAWLAQPGLDPNAPDDQGRTALFYAQSGEAVTLLCAAGVDPERLAADGRTARVNWDSPAEDCFAYAPQSPESRSDLMNALLAAQGSTPSSSLLTEWVHAWASRAPEAWDTLKHPLQADLLAHRIPMRTSQASGSQVVDWGVLGYMALQIGAFYPNDPQAVPCIQAWAQLGRTVPDALLNHESTPGVADGWVLLAALCQQTGLLSLGGTLNKAGAAALAVWANRMMPGTPQAARGRQWRMGVLRAVGVMLEQLKFDGKKDLGKQGLAELVRMFLGKEKAVLPSDGWASANLRREMATHVLCTPSFRPILVNDITFLEGIEVGPWVKGPTPAVQWGRCWTCTGSPTVM